MTTPAPNPNLGPVDTIAMRQAARDVEHENGVEDAGTRNGVDLLRRGADEIDVLRYLLGEAQGLLAEGHEVEHGDGEPGSNPPEWCRNESVHAPTGREELPDWPCRHVLVATGVADAEAFWEKTLPDYAAMAVELEEKARAECESEGRHVPSPANIFVCTRCGDEIDYDPDAVRDATGWHA